MLRGDLSSSSFLYTRRSAALTPISSDLTQIFTHAPVCHLMGVIFLFEGGEGGRRDDAKKTPGEAKLALSRDNNGGDLKMSGGDDITEPPNHLHHRSCMLSSVSACVCVCLFPIYFCVYLHLCELRLAGEALCLNMWLLRRFLSNWACCIL